MCLDWSLELHLFITLQPIFLHNCWRTIWFFFDKQRLWLVLLLDSWNLRNLKIWASVVFRIFRLTGLGVRLSRAGTKFYSGMFWTLPHSLFLQQFTGNFLLFKAGGVERRAPLWGLTGSGVLWDLLLFQGICYVYTARLRRKPSLATCRIDRLWGYEGSMTGRIPIYPNLSFLLAEFFIFLYFSVVSHSIPLTAYLVIEGHSRQWDVGRATRRHHEPQVRSTHPPKRL